MRRAWQDDQRRCEWHNQDGEQIASMDVMRLSKEELDCSYEWIENGKRQQRRVVFAILNRPSPTGRLIPDAQCSGCGRVKPTLYLVRGDWRCPKCHGLVTLASLLDPTEKLLVQAWGLQEAVRLKPAPTRGFREHDRKKHKLRMIEHKLGATKTIRLREHLRAQVGQRWMDPFDGDSEGELTGIGYRELDLAIKIGSPRFG